MEATPKLLWSPDGSRDTQMDAFRELVAKKYDVKLGESARFYAS